METTRNHIRTHLTSIIGETAAFVKDVIIWSLSGVLALGIFVVSVLLKPALTIEQRYEGGH